MVRIAQIEAGSIAEELHLEIGSRIVRINGHRVRDGIDLTYLLADTELELENVIVTGHSGHYSDVTAATLRRRPLEDSQRIIAGEWPIGWLNPEVEAKYAARWGGLGIKT